MPEVPLLLKADSHLKKPDWLNNPLNYHDRGNIDFGSCSQQCFEQGDFYGLDDLFTEKPNVMNGLAQIYSSWITRFHVDGFRVDTAKHVNAAFFKLWVPKIRAAARSVGIADFPIFGEVTLNDTVDLSAFVRDRGLPQVLDFPFQQVATAYASGATGAKGLGFRLQDDDYFRLPNGIDPAFTTFLGNHDMGRGAQQILSQAPGLAGNALLRHVLLGYDLLYLLRGAPTLLYGDEVGMIGSGGDQAAREDMFPTQVSDWQTEPRVGSPPIGKGSSFDVTANPIEAAAEAAVGGSRCLPRALDRLVGRAPRGRRRAGRLAHRLRDRPRGGDGVQQRRYGRARDGSGRDAGHDVAGRIRQRHGHRDGLVALAHDPAGLRTRRRARGGDPGVGTRRAETEGVTRPAHLVRPAVGNGGR